MNDLEKLPTVLPAPVSLIFTVFNQQTTLATEIGAWVQVLNELDYGHEIIAVDDGSFDGTHAIADELTTKFSNLRILRHDIHRGFGIALRAGLAAAHHPLVAYAAGGEGYYPAGLKSMLKWIDEVHLVAGYRVSAEKAARQVISRWLHRQLARTVFGVHMRDLGCRFLLARRSIFERIPIQSKGPFAHVEVLAKANFVGCLMTEVPVRLTGKMTHRQPESKTRADAMRLLRDPNFGPVTLDV